MRNGLVVITQDAIQLPISVDEQPGVDEFRDGRLAGFLAVLRIEEFVVAHLDRAVQFAVVVKRIHRELANLLARWPVIAPADVLTYGLEKSLSVLHAGLVV